MDDARFTSLIERMDDRFAGIVGRMDDRFAEHRKQMDERDQRLIDRMRSSEQHFIEALAENTAELKIISDRQNEISATLVANTKAVLSVIDRLDDLESGTA